MRFSWRLPSRFGLRPWWCFKAIMLPRSTYEHGEIAANVLAGRGFSIRFLGAEGPTSQQAPVYPSLVAAAYAAGGVEQPAALLLLELSQSVLGGLLVLGVLRLSRQIAPGCPAAAWWAGLISAVHPSLVYAATHVQVALRGGDVAGMGFGLGLPRGDDGLQVGRDHRGRSPGAVGFDRSDPVTRGASACWVPSALGRPRTASRRSSSVLAEPDHVRCGGAWRGTLDCEMPWCTANSWRSRAHSVMPSGRETAIRAKGRTRSSGRRWSGHLPAAAAKQGFRR